MFKSIVNRVVLMLYLLLIYSTAPLIHPSKTVKTLQSCSTANNYMMHLLVPENFIHVIIMQEVVQNDKC